jgi:hypothetical protein
MFISASDGRVFDGLSLDILAQQVLAICGIIRRDSQLIVALRQIHAGFFHDHAF